jgi:MarR family transcriptional regulator, organic hydroperoxide resistance regulator
MKDKKELTLGNFSIEDVLGSIINKAAIIIRKRLSIMLKEKGYDITPEEFALLSRLWETDGVPQSELVEKTLKDKTRVTRLLGGLVDKSYVKKEVDKSDRRNYIVSLTEKGKDMRTLAIPIVIQLMKQAVEGIDSRDVDVTKKVLKKVFENLNSII